MKIYLCGPIDGVTPEWATGWRQALGLLTTEKSLSVLVPSEGKHPDCPLKEVEEDE